ncbi:ACP S-malonyltransferase [Gynuella sunshinyii]|nr:ACP S-malonyltransferase [Gynuella sunshinyii]
MPKVFLFPGQGSQHKGMGAELFPKYPQLVSQADDILGYSIVELCLNDPAQQLNQTRFTQPALFVVNALSYYEHCQHEGSADYLAGHSLGEFNALLAAGAYDFATGLTIVRERGRLMAAAEGGGMAALIGLDADRVEQFLQDHALTGIDIANYNSSDQIIVSGALSELDTLQSLLSDSSDCRYIPLNVSAAFHSRYMDASQRAFADILSQFTFAPLSGKVISNWSADFYPTENYLDHIAGQLNSPVKWYQSMSRLLACGEMTFTELGPGNVLTRLAEKIVRHPQPVVVANLSAAWQAECQAVQPDTNAKPKKNLFMYADLGSQYYQMGKALLQQDAVFREAMQACDVIIRQASGHSLLDELYHQHAKTAEFTDVRWTQAAIFSVAYSLTRTMEARGIRADAVLGCGVGEYVAAVIAGVLTLSQGLGVIMVQGDILIRGTHDDQGMLAVLTDVAHVSEHPQLYASVELAGVNYQHHFVLSGARRELDNLRAGLSAQGIASMMLPVAVAFHSSLMQPFEPDWRDSLKTLTPRAARIPWYSAASADLVDKPDTDYFWQISRAPVRFYELMRLLSQQDQWRYIDLSPTASLTAYIRHGFSELEPHGAMTPYGDEFDPLQRLVAEVNG